MWVGESVNVNREKLGRSWARHPCVDVDKLLGWPLGADTKRKGAINVTSGCQQEAPARPMRSLHIRLRTNRQMMAMILMTIMMVSAVMMMVKI